MPIQGNSDFLSIIRVIETWLLLAVLKVPIGGDRRRSQSRRTRETLAAGLVQETIRRSDHLYIHHFFHTMNTRSAASCRWLRILPKQPLCFLLFFFPVCVYHIERFKNSTIPFHFFFLFLFYAVVRSPYVSS